MTVATAGAFAIHQLVEAVAVMVFFKVGEILQSLSVRRSRQLHPSAPRAAARCRAAASKRRPSGGPAGRGAARCPGGGPPGERIPLDGIVLSGTGFVDTSALTGEPTPRRIEPGQEVLAGFISTDGSIEIRVSRSAGESSAAQIIHLVEEASHAKARTEHFITPLRPRLHPHRGRRCRRRGLPAAAAAPRCGPARLGVPRAHHARHLLPVRARRQHSAGVLRRRRRRLTSRNPREGGDVPGRPGVGEDHGVRQDRHAHERKLRGHLGAAAERRLRARSPALCGARGGALQSPHRRVHPSRLWRPCRRLPRRGLPRGGRAGGVRHGGGPLGHGGQRPPAASPGDRARHMLHRRHRGSRDRRREVRGIPRHQ